MLSSLSIVLGFIETFIGRLADIPYVLVPLFGTR